MTNTQRLDTEEKIPEKMPKKSESNLNPKTKKLKDANNTPSEGM